MSEDYSLMSDPMSMLKALVAFAPEGNLRYGLLVWLDFVDEISEDDDVDLLDALAQALVTLHVHSEADDGKLDKEWGS